MFLYSEETFLSNYADDNTLHSIGNRIKSVKKALSNDFRIIHLMVLNAKKCHYMCFGICSENNEFVFHGIKLPNICEEKILGLIINNDLKFNPHIRSVCKIAAQKLIVLKRISSLLDPEKEKLVSKNSLYQYSPEEYLNFTTEVFKVDNNICPPIVKTFFDFNENRYNIRKFQELRQQKVRTVR